MTVKNDGLLPFNNTFPAIIEWGDKTIHPSKSLPKVDCELFHLSIYHPLVEDLRFNLKNLNDKRISFIQNNEKGIVAEFKTIEEAQSWIKSDPYYINGVFKDVIVKPFKVIFP